MGLRILLYLFLLAFASVAIAARATPEDPRAHTSRWHASAMTSQDEVIALRFRPTDDRLVAFDTKLAVRCTWSDETFVVHWWPGHRDKIPFHWRGDRLTVVESVGETTPDGTRASGVYRLDAVVGRGAVRGRMRMSEKRTRGGRRVGGCDSGVVSFRVPRG